MIGAILPALEDLPHPTLGMAAMREGRALPGAIPRRRGRPAVKGQAVRWLRSQADLRRVALNQGGGHWRRVECQLPARPPVTEHTVISTELIGRNQVYSPIDNLLGRA
jgi:hypothetical protein